MKNKIMICYPQLDFIFVCSFLEPTTSDYCMNMRRPPASSVIYHNVYWQRLTSKSPPKDLVVYSAFYDTRPAVGLIPVVRILAVMQGYNDSTVIHCQIWYADENRQPLLVIANILRTGRGHKIGKVIYGQYMFTCPIDAQFGTTSVIPSHVSLSFERCAPSTTFIPIKIPFAAPVSDSVESRVGASFAHEFGMCVAIAFGKSINDQWLIEWFELHAILGVTEINVYNATLNLSAATNDVLAFYQRTGLLRVFQMPPPVNGTDIDAVKLASPASLNDCLMRNMYRYRHTVVVDFDEVILPRIHLTYSDLVLALNRVHRLNDTYYSYAFRNAFFLLDFPTVPPIIKDLRGHDRPSDREVIEGREKGNDLFLVRQRGRAPVSRFLYSAKSFVNPRNCLSVFNHYCYVPFSANETLSNAPRVVDVHQSFAQVHHYRLCNRDKMPCSNMLSAPERDDAILAFSDKLSQRVQHVRSMLNI